MQQQQNNGEDPCDNFINKDIEVLFNYPAIETKLQQLIHPGDHVGNNCNISYQEDFDKSEFILSYNGTINNIIDLKLNIEYDICKSFFTDFYNNINDDDNKKECIKKMIAIICSLMLLLWKIIISEEKTNGADSILHEGITQYYYRENLLHQNLEYLKGTCKELKLYADIDNNIITKANNLLLQEKINILLNIYFLLKYIFFQNDDSGGNLTILIQIIKIDLSPLFFIKDNLCDIYNSINDGAVFQLDNNGRTEIEINKYFKSLFSDNENFNEDKSVLVDFIKEYEKRLIKKVLYDDFIIDKANNYNKLFDDPDSIKIANYRRSVKTLFPSQIEELKVNFGSLYSLLFGKEFGQEFGNVNLDDINKGNPKNDEEIRKELLKYKAAPPHINFDEFLIKYRDKFPLFPPPGQQPGSPLGILDNIAKLKKDLNQSFNSITEKLFGGVRVYLKIGGKPVAEGDKIELHKERNDEIKIEGPFDESKYCKSSEDKKILSFNPLHKGISYNELFDHDKTNKQIYDNTLKKIIDDMIAPSNSPKTLSTMVFGYGYSGSGKTYLLFNIDDNNAKNDGLLFQILNHITELNNTQLNNTQNNSIESFKIVDINECMVKYITENSELYDTDFLSNQTVTTVKNIRKLNTPTEIKNYPIAFDAGQSRGGGNDINEYEDEYDNLIVGGELVPVHERRAIVAKLVNCYGFNKKYIGSFDINAPTEIRLKMDIGDAEDKYKIDFTEKDFASNNIQTTKTRINTILTDLQKYRKKNGTIKWTPNNNNSSRSHLLIRIKIVFKNGNTIYISFIDMAGLESSQYIVDNMTNTNGRQSFYDLEVTPSEILRNKKDYHWKKLMNIRNDLCNLTDLKYESIIKYFISKVIISILQFKNYNDFKTTPEEKDLRKDIKPWERIPDFSDTNNTKWRKIEDRNRVPEDQRKDEWVRADTRKSSVTNRNKELEKYINLRVPYLAELNKGDRSSAINIIDIIDINKHNKELYEITIKNISNLYEKVKLYKKECKNPPKPRQYENEKEKGSLSPEGYIRGQISYKTKKLENGNIRDYKKFTTIQDLILVLDRIIAEYEYLTNLLEESYFIGATVDIVEKIFKTGNFDRDSGLYNTPGYYKDTRIFEFLNETNDIKFNLSGFILDNINPLVKKNNKNSIIANKLIMFGNIREDRNKIDDALDTFRFIKSLDYDSSRIPQDRNEFMNIPRGPLDNNPPIPFDVRNTRPNVPNPHRPPSRPPGGQSRQRGGNDDQDNDNIYIA